MRLITALTLLSFTFFSNAEPVTAQNVRRKLNPQRHGIPRDLKLCILNVLLPSVSVPKFLQLVTLMQQLRQQKL